VGTFMFVSLDAVFRCALRDPMKNSVVAGSRRKLAKLIAAQ